MSGTYDGGSTWVANDDWCYPMLWKKVVMDRFIALSAALAAEFEDEPAFEAIAMLSETALGQLRTTVCWSDPCGDETRYTLDYSADAFVTQINRLTESMTTDWPTTNRVVFMNFIPNVSASAAESVVATLRDEGGMHGWPDTMPQGIKPSSCGTGCTNPGTVRDRALGQRIRLGLVGSGTNYTGAACMSAVQAPEMGGNGGNHTPSDLFAESDGILKCSHIMWTRKMWQIDVPADKGGEGGGGLDEANWLSGGTLDPDGLKSFIDAGSADSTNTSCPRNYAAFGGCR